jgi:hypothetical protein
VRKARVYIRQFSVLRILHTMTVVCSVSLSYSIHDLPAFVNKVRYHNQLDVHHSTPMMMPQYDYGHSLNTQQPPMLHTIQQPPSSNSRHVTFSHYNLPTRNHIGADFSPQTPRIPSVSHAAPIDFRYPPERRLSSVTSHDRIPEQLEFQWIMIMVITGSLLVHIQKPLLLLLNRVRHPKTHARRHRRLS